MHIGSQGKTKYRGLPKRRNRLHCLIGQIDAMKRSSFEHLLLNGENVSKMITYRPIFSVKFYYSL